MSSGKVASWAEAEEFAELSTLTFPALVIDRARERGQEAGSFDVSAGTGQALRLLTALAHANTVVEVGTGSAVGSLYLLDGMAKDGVLTTIDEEVENQRLARETFAEAKLASGRTRLINGKPVQVMRRLTDQAYDLVVIEAHLPEVTQIFEQAKRIVRPGGTIAFKNALLDDRLADPIQRGAEVAAMRALLKELREDEAFKPALLPAGGGVLAAVYKP